MMAALRFARGGSIFAADPQDYAHLIHECDLLHIRS
jgi:hypothetical protein